MKNLLNFKTIKAKMLLAFSFVIILVFLFSAFTLYSNSKSNERAQEMIDKQLPLLLVDESLNYNMANRAGLLRAYLLYEDESYRKAFEDQIDASIALEEKLKKLTDSKTALELLDKRMEWGKLTDEVFAAYDRGDKEKALQLMKTEVGPLEQEIMDGFSAASLNRENLISEEGQKVIESGNTTMLISTILSIAVLLLGVGISLLSANLMTKPIKKLMERMKAIASGDLSQPDLETTDRDEIAQLMHATNEMNTSMRALLNQINYVSETVSGHSEELTQSTNEVRGGAEQIASTMEELANGTETQANSAGDLSSTMSSFAIQVQEANENGGRVQHDSKEVLAMTNEGSSLMESSTTQMQKIDQIVQEAVHKVEGLDAHAQQISNLVSVIKDVAEQTNLLALNAAIEAARAGEHGKGFAVVADEVRKLAEQVSYSVNDITGIVTNIQTESANVTESLKEGYKEVELGTDKIEATGETFTKISNAVSDMVSSITTITTNLTSIAENSQEMNSAIQEIAAVSEESAAGVEQTSASAQQVSTSMEEVAGSSEQLAKLAEELNGLVRNFKL